MQLGGHGPLEWLALLEYELLLFAGVFFLLGALDDLAVDAVWAWLRLTGRATTPLLDRGATANRELADPVALFLPAWRESAVIGTTIAHARAAWPQSALTIYVGCYRNDPDTLTAAMQGASGDGRVRIVVLDRDGPTTKADCLNWLYHALADDERRGGYRTRMVLLHDAEDMVDPVALPVLETALREAEFVQLPVLPEPQGGSRWIASHYCEEFAEAHGKAMVVRQAVGAGLPAAGVGCAIDRVTLARLEAAAGPEAPGPFSVESLTEDYEMGLRIAATGGRSSFLRLRGDDGALVATRSIFPDRLDEAVRQKTRWVHGIAFQGWDRLGWQGGIAERWMRLRDRRGPLTALVLAAAYLLLAVASVLEVATWLGWSRPWDPDPLVRWLVTLNLCCFGWRVLLRFAFTAREYGAVEGVRAVLRIPLANIIAIMAGRRALVAYLRSLGGSATLWDKTEHRNHPATPHTPTHRIGTS